MGQRGKREFFFRFSISSPLFIRHFFFFDKKKKTTKKKTKKKMIFNLEGLTVYFPYEYLYPVRFKRVDFLTLLFCYHFLRRASLSFFPSAHDSDDDVNDDDDDASSSSSSIYSQQLTSSQ